MNKDALKNFILCMADDALILGHRNSEWTGIGPTLEEDLAFSSMAQDKIGHAQRLYEIIHESGLDPRNDDQLGFRRTEKEFFCCHLVEQPINGFDFSLVRHFFYDHAEQLRYAQLENCSFEPLSNFAKKIKGELRFHIMHANTWIRDLGSGTEEGKARIQSAINELYPFALGVFEESNSVKESQLDLLNHSQWQQDWKDQVEDLLGKAGFDLPVETTPVFGGRNQYHSEHLEALLSEMTEVLSLDPDADW